MKRVLALTLAMLFVLCALVACSNDQTNEGGTITPVESNVSIHNVEGSQYNDQLYFDYINGDEVVITGFAASHVPHALVIPEKIDNRPVTTIAAGAFMNKVNLTAVTLPNGIAVIEDMAFAACNALTSINIPDSVTLIGEAAFTNTAITEISLPNSVLALGQMAFFNCQNLATVTLSTELTAIQKQTFMNCVALTSVTVGDKVEAIEDYAFMGCSLLSSLTLPASVTAIGEYAFANCTAFTRPALDETVEIGTNAFYGTVSA
ncbi:MAG: leucine-rich repeat domain-containing protein [Ruminococcaceae bacterium]|nr:leucine-rich repeat domain-containing protein [Oscillospiraceae bacterium]